MNRSARLTAHAEAPPLIMASNVAVRYGAAPPVLRDIDFAIRPGEIVTIVGPNGSGKSTFLRAVLGMIPVARGRVARAGGLRLGYVPQRLHLEPTLPLSVARFLTLYQPMRAGQVAELLARVGVPGLAGQAMDTLSGGQFQRVLLARALAGRPQLLALDEPTQGLDQAGIAGFYRLIAELRAEIGCAVLSVSHDLHVVMSASDRVICINGHICCEGTPSVVSAAPEYRALFGLGTGGALALYRHEHDHGHEHDHAHAPHRDETDRDAPHSI